MVAAILRVTLHAGGGDESGEAFADDHNDQLDVLGGFGNVDVTY